ncbi:MAG TPA: hypothetical protein VL966_14245 [Alphaproteobacteria bacterium]|jgi:hypothetical protein|nr:hypothetical protein [Alphaproteobacteria bacterium]
MTADIQEELEIVAELLKRAKQLRKAAADSTSGRERSKNLFLAEAFERRASELMQQINISEHIKKEGGGRSSVGG